MARSLNKVQLIGNLGKDPELRYTTAGVAVATFTIATNESWKDQDGNLQERTEWHNIVAWRKLAEICGEWLKKGKKVYIEGRLQTRSYDDKNTGTKKYITEIVADNMIMLDGKGGAESGGGGGSQPAAVHEEPSPVGG
ncbi:MAG: single-stranded DNA-binding protein, partial [Bacteroidota bacterium]